MRGNADATYTNLRSDRLSQEGQGSALDPLGPEAPGPHSLRVVGGTARPKNILLFISFAK
jgi:hypothetical protein